MVATTIAVTTPGAVIELKGRTLPAHDIRADNVTIVGPGVIDAKGLPYAVQTNRVNASGPRKGLFVKGTRLQGVTIRGASSKLVLAWWTKLDGCTLEIEEAQDGIFCAIDPFGRVYVEMAGGSIKRLAPPAATAAHADLIQLEGGIGNLAGAPALYVHDVELVASCPGWIGSSVIFGEDKWKQIAGVSVKRSRLVGGAYGLRITRQAGSPYGIEDGSIEVEGNTFEGFGYGPWQVEPADRANNYDATNSIIR